MTLPIQMQKTPAGIAGGKENGNLALKFPFFFPLHLSLLIAFTKLISMTDPSQLDGCP